MKNDNSFKPNPFKKLWNFVTTIGGILGLASLGDDFIAWKNVIPDMIEAYKVIIYFPFRFFEIGLSDTVVDYLFLGSICGGAFIKAIDFGEKNVLLNTYGNGKSVRIFYFILYLLFWPLAILISLKQVLIGEPDVSEKLIKLNFIRWLGTLILGFIIVLLINSFL